MEQIHIAKKLQGEHMKMMILIKLSLQYTKTVKILYYYCKFNKN